MSRKSASIEEIDEPATRTRATRSNSTAAPLKTLAMHPRPTASAPEQEIPTDVATEEDSPFATVLAALESTFDSVPPSKNGVKVSGILNKMYFQYKFPTYKDNTSGSHKRPVEEIIHYNAAALLDAIDPQKYQNGEVYEWLERLSKTKFAPIAMKANAFPYRIVLREQRPFHGRKPEKTVAKVDTPQDDIRPPSPSTPRLGKRPGRPVGSKSSLRPIKSTKKRSRTIVDDETDTESVAKKLNFQSDHDGDGDDGDDSMVDIQNQISQEFDSGLELNASSDSSSEDENTDEEDKPVKLSILAEKLPDQMPTGYQGTWICDQPDCDFIARGGEDDELDDRISAHLHEHERLVDKMQLALNESRGLLPIK